jgi:hypothetical protein
MKIVRVFTQGREEYIVTDDHKVFRIGRTFRNDIRIRGEKPYLSSESALKEMKDFHVS